MDWGRDGGKEGGRDGRAKAGREERETVISQSPLLRLLFVCLCLSLSLYLFLPLLLCLLLSFLCNSWVRVGGPWDIYGVILKVLSGPTWEQEEERRRGEEECCGNPPSVVFTALPLVTTPTSCPLWNPDDCAHTRMNTDTHRHTHTRKHGSSVILHRAIGGVFFLFPSWAKYLYVFLSLNVSIVSFYSFSVNTVNFQVSWQTAH